jgi:HEAT repeat protein
MTSPTASPRSLFDIRSDLAGDLIGWYEALSDHFDETDWKRPGVGSVSLKSISVDAKVYREARRRPEHEDHGLRSAPNRSKMAPELARINEEPPREKRPELVLWKDEIPSTNHAVILGAPGAGKSFLAAAMVIQTAEEELKKIIKRRSDLHSATLPVFLKLEALAEANAQGAVEDIVIDLLRQYLPVGPTLANWMKQRLFTKQCLWILDGLDQVGGEVPVKRVDRWLARIEQSQCRAVVTCRTQSFTAQRAPGKSFVQYDLAPFDWAGIRRFIGNWYGDDDSRGTHLLSVLQAKGSLEDSCRTPLIATLACLVNEDRNRPLPQSTSRVELYEKIIRRFQDEEGKSGLDDIEREAEFIQLQRLAWNLFSARPESNQFAGTEVLSAAPETDVRLAAELMKRLLRTRILIKGGVSVADGAPQYSFVHRTVLEFLAAKYMASVVEKQGWEAAQIEMAEKRSVVSLISVIDRKSWLPAWSATIVLLSGCLGRRAEALVGSLWGGRRDVARHRPALALQCLAEVNAEEREEGQVDRLTSQTFGFLWEHEERHSTHAIASFDICWKALAEINGRIDGKPLMDLLGQAAINGEIAAVRALGEIGPAVSNHEHLIRALVGCLYNQDDGNVRMEAARVLGRVGIETRRNDVIATLADSFRSDNDAGVSWTVAYTLAEMGPNAALHIDVLPAMLGALSKKGFSFAKLGALNALGAMGEATAYYEGAVPALVGFLRGEPDFSAREYAVEALGEIGRAGVPGRQDIITALLHSLRDDENSTVRSRAARSLGRMGKAAMDSASVVAALLRTIHEDADEWVRRSAEESLEQTNTTAFHQDSTVPRFRSSFEESNHSIRLKAAQALRWLGEKAHQREELVRSIRQNEDRFTQWLAANLGGDLRMPDLSHKALIHEGLQCLHDEDDGVRAHAARVLEAMFQLGLRVFEQPQFEVAWVQRLGTLC